MALDPNLATQLKAYLENLREPIELVATLDDGAKSTELDELLVEIEGMSAQITAACAIGLANVYSLPVSTTHVLSSGVAGTMVANRSGLQGSTISNILLAWVLTLPTSMALAAGLFYVSTLIFG